MVAIQCTYEDEKDHKGKGMDTALVEDVDMGVDVADLHYINVQQW